MTLKQFLKNNKARRLVLAQKAGYSTVEEYKLYLESLSKYVQCDLNIGDKVEIIDVLEVYSTYDRMFKHFNFGYDSIDSNSINTRKVYKVIGTSYHEYDINQVLVAIEDVKNSKIKLLFNIKGLKLINKKVLNNASKTSNVSEVVVLRLVDASGSMGDSNLINGSKIDAANEGLRIEIEKFKSNKETFKYGVFSFHTSSSGLKTIVKIDNLNKANLHEINANGSSTALYKAIVDMFNLILPYKNKAKVLFSIFTDGQNNDAHSYRDNAAKLIKDNSDWVTTTFVGTEYDVKRVSNDLNIDKSNTLVYDNTGKGLEKSFTATVDATLIYSNAVSNNEDVSRGFYKKMS